MGKKEMQVSAIENGTVIDHIPAEKTYEVVDLLGLKNSLDPVTIGYNIKITNRFFSQEEISRLSVVAPKIVLNIIKDYEVAEKKTVELPEELRGIVKCNNPKCITNNEPMQTVFNVIDKAQGILKCRYCDKEQDINNIKLC